MGTLLLGSIVSLAFVSPVTATAGAAAHCYQHAYRHEHPRVYRVCYRVLEIAPLLRRGAPASA